MADRSRRARARQISEVTDDFSEQSASESELDWDPRKADMARRAGKIESLQSAGTLRSRKGGDDKQQSIRLTMKVAPSKLREVTRANELDSLQDTLGGGRVIDGPRSRRAAATNPRLSGRAGPRPRYAEYGESELEEDEEGGEDEDEEEEEEEDDDEEEDEEDIEAEVTGPVDDFDEVGAEAEGGTEGDEDEEEEEEEDEDEDEEDEDEEDEDVEMEDAPPIPPTRKQPIPPKPPKITLKPPPKSGPRAGAKAKVTVTPAEVGPLKSVEDQEMEDDPGDEEVEEGSSELSEDEDATNLNGDDAEGDEEALDEEDVEGDDAELEDDDDDENDSGDETPASGMATPDPNRLTKRQRGRPEDQTQLMALDMAPQQRKFFTDEEKAMKKDEHARKRKELTKRKIMEEKTAALNRLLKPQASKARGAAPKPETLAAATAAAAAAEEDDTPIKADPLYTRWISTKNGIQLGVPEEWLGKRVGRSFGPPPPPSNGTLVQEVE